MKKYLVVLLFVICSFSAYAQMSSPQHICVSRTGVSDWCTVLDPDTRNSTDIGNSEEDHFFEARSTQAFENLHHVILLPGKHAASVHSRNIDVANGFVVLAIAGKGCGSGPCQIELRNPRVETNSQTGKRELIIQFYRQNGSTQDLQVQRVQPTSNRQPLLIVAILPIAKLPVDLRQQLLGITKWSDVSRVGFEIMGDDGSIIAPIKYALTESEYPTVDH